MSLQTWGLDAPTTGAYDEHIVSDAFRAASSQTVFFRYAEMKKIASGKSLTVPIVDVLSLPNSAVLNESEYIPLSKLSITAKSITPSGRGRGVKWTHQTERRSPIDILAEHRRSLEDMMSRDLDSVVKGALDDTNLDYVANGAASQSITTTGTPTATCASDPNFYHMRYLARYMRDDLRIPSRSNGNLVAVFRWKGIQALRDDPEFLAFNTGRPEGMKDFAIGQIEGFDVVGTNHSILSSSIGSGSVYSEGLLFGAEAVYFAFLDMPSLHYDFSEDFGRFKSIAWYGDYGAGLSSDSTNAGLVRCIHWTSA